MAALELDFAAWGVAPLLFAPFLAIDAYIIFLLWKAGARFHDTPLCLAKAWSAVSHLARKWVRDE
jgi:hypothetical protein